MAEEPNFDVGGEDARDADGVVRRVGRELERGGGAMQSHVCTFVGVENGEGGN